MWNTAIPVFRAPAFGPEVASAEAGSVVVYVPYRELPGLTLALLMPRIRVADDHNAAVTANDFAMVANSLHAWFDLHMSFPLPYYLEHYFCAETVYRLLVPVNDAAAVQIVGRKLYDNAVVGKDLDVVLTHFAGDVSEHDVPVFQLDVKHRIRLRFNYGAFYLDDAFFFTHVPRFFGFLLAAADPKRPRHRHTALLGAKYQQSILCESERKNKREYGVSRHFGRLNFIFRPAPEEKRPAGRKNRGSEGRGRCLPRPSDPKIILSRLSVYYARCFPVLLPKRIPAPVAREAADSAPSITVAYPV